MRSPEKVAVKNLSVWHKAATDNRELRLLQSRALGRATAQDAQKSTAELHAPALPLATVADAPLTPSGDCFAHSMLCEERLAFCRGVLDVLKDLQTEALPALSAPPAAARIAFLDGFFSREAMRSFERLLPRARAVTAPSFTTVCEEMVSGNAELALLPIEDSREGKLLHLYDLIDRFELQITHTCDVSYPDEGRTLTVALLSHLYRPITKTPGEQLLALSVFEEDPHTLGDLIQAALACGHTLKRVDSRAAPYGVDGMVYQPIFSVVPDGEQLFLLYLSQFLKRTRVIGRYQHLQSKGDT